MIQGNATPNDTLHFFKKFPNFNKKNLRKIHDLTLSNVGIGTYLGRADDETDLLVKNAVKNSILGGINVIDTAINYRAQKAERSVGKAVSELIEQNAINRNEIFLSTKNGYVTNDGDIKEDFWDYVNREYVSKGIIKPNDISSGYHCMTIPYLEDQLERSRKNLGVECIDLLYLHNASEGQLKDISKEEFMKNLQLAFELYESKRKEGIIQFYGMATWECFRVQKDNLQFIQLSEIMDIAHKAGGTKHGFKFIQLPYNMYLDQALMLKNQNINGEQQTILEAAKFYDVGLFTSVPLMQAKLLTPGVIPEFGGLSPSLRAIQFVRSTPGVLAPLIGQKNSDHVKENIEILKIPSLIESEFFSLVNKFTNS